LTTLVIQCQQHKVIWLTLFAIMETLDLTVEVTMQSGQRQYETEGEPVTRHLAKYKRETEKPAYCLFIAPNINDACKAHFYALHKMNIQYYGGTSTIVPLPLSVFIKMVQILIMQIMFPNQDTFNDFLSVQMN
jgi:hypothetical protein